MRVHHKHTGMRSQTEFQGSYPLAYLHFIPFSHDREKKWATTCLTEWSIGHATSDEGPQSQGDGLSREQPVFHIDGILAVRHDDAFEDLAAMTREPPCRSLPFSTKGHQVFEDVRVQSAVC